MSSSKNENAVMLLMPRAVFIIQSRTRVYFVAHCLHVTRCGWSCSLDALILINMVIEVMRGLELVMCN